MSAPFVLEVDGVKYRAADLARMAGVCSRTITLRHRQHPEWGLEELTQPNMNPEIVELEHNGKRQTLAEWAREMGVPYDTVKDRWKRGVRRFDYLFLPYNANRKAPPKIYVSKEALEWLRETRWARKGQPDEWEIACDLIGIDRWHAGTLRRMLA